MKLRTLFRKLSHGELSSLAIGSEGDGLIPESYVPRVVTFVNEGLLRFHARFPLKTADLILVQQAGITNYHLVRRNAEFGSKGRPSSHPYIKDLPCEPFDADILQIQAVYDRHGDRPLNDQGDPRSVFTPQHDTIQVPRPRDGEPLGVTYQARHRPLCEQNDNGVDAVLDQEIELPYYLESPLAKFVASCVFEGLGGDENEKRSAVHLARCDAICKEAEEKDLVGQTLTTSHHKLQMRGFV